MTIRDPATTSCCEAINTADFIDLSNLPSQILATIAYQPRIATVLDEMINEAGRIHFHTKPLTAYMNEEDGPLYESLNFYEVCAIVSKHSEDVVVGWSVPTHETER